MRQFILAAILIAVPVALFFGVLRWQSAGEATGASLGDMSAFSTIVTDVQSIAAKGDLAGAAARITDLETAWDDAQAALQPVNPDAWGTVDTAIDGALKSLRAASPDAGAVNAALVNLETVLADPMAAPQTGTVQKVDGILITDDTGHYLPCETMIKQVRAGTLSPEINDLITKATERCNADDDLHANTFSAQALAKQGAK